jgi:hypothetical protein
MAMTTMNLQRHLRLGAFSTALQRMCLGDTKEYPCLVADLPVLQRLGHVRTLNHVCIREIGNGLSNL